MSAARTLLPVLASSLLSTPVLANPDTTSREYKLMLDPGRFTHGTEASAVTALFFDAKATIEQAIDRDVSGSPVLEKQREVRYFDTPQTCKLRELGYSFRERVENGDSEVSLKFRSPDRYIADFEDLDSDTNGAETKLEADIGANAWTDFKVIYSHSTKAPNSRNINEVHDINEHFPDFERDHDLDDDLPLVVVGNLDIREHVYSDVEIDLGQHDAEIDVTLWYAGAPSSGQTPLVAEISFKYEDGSADYTQKVVHRAKTAFHALQGLTDWVNPASRTKTRFVYEYDPAFCQN
jgi:hypothetical protein